MKNYRVESTDGRITDFKADSMKVNEYGVHFFLDKGDSDEIIATYKEYAYAAINEKYDH